MFLIREARQEDYIDIANIHFISWNAAYLALLPKSYINKENSLAKRKEVWQEVIAHPNVSVWIAYDSSDNDDDNNKQNYVGFIGYFSKGNDYEITTLYVLPECHNLGIGTQLMRQALTTILKSTHNPSLCLWVLKDNISAINFYKKHGFIASGESSEELYEEIKIVDIKMTRSIDTIKKYCS